MKYPRSQDRVPAWQGTGHLGGSWGQVLILLDGIWGQVLAFGWHLGTGIDFA